MQGRWSEGRAGKICNVVESDGQIAYLGKYVPAHSGWGIKYVWPIFNICDSPYNWAGTLIHFLTRWKNQFIHQPLTALLTDGSKIRMADDGSLETALGS